MSSLIRRIERVELAARPVASGFTALTATQIAYRRLIALTWAEREWHNPKRPAWVAGIYAQAPKHRFYLWTPPHHSVTHCCRVFGVSHDVAGRACVRLARARSFYIYAPMDLVPLEEIQSIDAWRPEDMACIRHLSRRDQSVFIDPLGASWITQWYTERGKKGEHLW